MLNLLYADRWLLAVDKPAGLLTVPGRLLHERGCLAALVAENFPEARVVHRLDRDTSGVVLMARDAETHRLISAQFQQRLVSKRYQAVVHGRLDEDEGFIDLPLARWLAAPPRHRIDYSWGKMAHTRYRVVARRASTTRMELEPLTGRSHQLRVHLAAIGHPIVGDRLYAGYADSVGMTTGSVSARMLLHAERLMLTHPTTGELATIEAACPF